MSIAEISPEDYVEQHKLRLSYMPWLYFSLKEKHLVWARPWQSQIQARLSALETIQIGENVFIAPSAKLFAEPGRPIIIGDNSSIGADAVLHGPIEIGQNVAINHHAVLDGGRRGIKIGDRSRLAAYSCLYAFNHGMDVNRPVMSQAVTSAGITLGEDVWLGAHVGIVDGVTLGDGAVVGMGSLVTRNVPPLAKVAGSPACIIGYRK